MNNETNQGADPSAQQSSAGNKSPFDKEAIMAVIRPAADRAIAVLTKPVEIWNTLKSEPTTIKDVYTKYLLVMVAIPAVCQFIGGVIAGFPLKGNFIGQVVFYIIGLAGIWISAFVLEKLAPQFQGRADIGNTFKLVAYSSTPSYVAGFLALVPNGLFGLLRSLISLYGFYLLYKGLPVMTDVPENKRLVYFLVSLATIFVIWVVIAAIAGMFIMAGAAAGVAMTPTP